MLKRLELSEDDHKVLIDYCREKNITFMSTPFDEEVYLNKVALINGTPNYIGIPGQVVGFNNDNPIVKTKDSVVEITEYYSVKKIQIGGRFKI